MNFYRVVQISVHLDGKSFAVRVTKFLEKESNLKLLKKTRIPRQNSRSGMPREPRSNKNHLKIIIESQDRELVLKVNSEVHVFHRMYDDVDELHACNLQPMEQSSIQINVRPSEVCVDAIDRWHGNTRIYKATFSIPAKL